MTPAQELWGIETPHCPEKRLEVLATPHPVSHDSGHSDEDSLALLPRHTVVRINGNARTRGSLLGQTAIVKRAVGLGGWHWLVLGTGEEVKLQRNALQVLQFPTGNEQDFSEDEEEELRQQQLRQQQQQQQSHYQAVSYVEDKPRQRRPPSRPAYEERVASAPAHATPAASVSGGGAPLRRPHRSSPPSRINLGKLGIASLRRYHNYYKLPDSGPSASKEQLLSLVNQHFAAQQVDEGEVIASFLQAAKRHSAGLAR